jgi:hypothetical protein
MLRLVDFETQTDVSEKNRAPNFSVKQSKIIFSAKKSKVLD